MGTQANTLLDKYKPFVHGGHDGFYADLTVICQRDFNVDFSKNDLDKTLIVFDTPIS